ncbi:MAG: hypothetical protein EOO40_03520 [Deltaproteobacteria bacterium]|nr:MAG: hypothetical protein EOO40_03520 [Deltaproteobacteria bacterium]
MIVLFVGAILTCVTNCATASLATHPPTPPALQPAPQATDPELSASDLLHRGFELFHQDEDAAASQSFRDALGTGGLNDAGRSLAYWHIFVCEQSLGHQDVAAEALSSFVVAAQDVLQQAATGDDAEGFAVRFDLRRRLARARATLSAVWASHAAIVGRSITRPVLVYDDLEKDFFLQLAMPCAQTQHREVESPSALYSPLVERIDVRCDGDDETPRSFYFQTLHDPTL